jgi:phosphate transport system substrate-binding protein
MKVRTGSKGWWGRPLKNLMGSAVKSKAWWAMSKENVMPRIIMTVRLVGALVLACFMAALPSAAAGAAPAGAHSSVSLAEITGSGSTWSANAVNKWIANVYSQGVQVVFSPTGSAQGRQDFALHTVDFGVSDIGYQGFDSVTGTNDTSSRPYAYLPVTAGGTSFPYNIVVGGKRLTNLRLSGLTIAKIFMNKITNWDDPAVTKDNNGHQLPSLPITTVVPSEGSGTTAMFTRYLNFDFKSMWTAFNSGHSGMTEYWPRQGTSQVAQDGSTQIMNYVQSPSANGAIGITEYSYPLEAGFPVVQMENAAGYYVLPSEYNDAVALTKAVINYNQNSPNFLLENLNDVYNFNDPRTYPLSSYSYTIMPVAKNDPRMAVTGGTFPAKWQTMADFLYYSICTGQEYTGHIGYSALPVNLVEAGFKQLDRIKKAAPKVQIGQQNITTCHNPTFVTGHPNENYLAQVAPQPPLCDKAGHGPCTGVTNANANGGRGNGGSSPTPTPTASSSASPGSTPAPGSSSVPGVAPAGGQPGQPPANAGPPVADPAVLSAGESNNMTGVLEALAAVLLVAILAAPPLIARRLSARSRRQP